MIRHHLVISMRLSVDSACIFFHSTWQSRSNSTWISAQCHLYSIADVNTKETCLNVFFLLSLTRHVVKHKGLDHVIQLQASFFINTWYLVIPLIHNYTVLQAILCDWYATFIKKRGRLHSDSWFKWTIHLILTSFDWAVIVIQVPSFRCFTSRARLFLQHQPWYTFSRLIR